MGFWDGGAAVGGSILGGGLSMIGQHQANIANAKEADKNREFQERMSSTAHQREVADLRAAGLNPILSAGGGGSSTPSGGQANIQSTTEGLSHSAKNIAPMLAALAQVKAQTAQTEAQTALAPNQRKLLEAQTASALASARATEKTAFLGDAVQYGGGLIKSLGERLGFTGNPKRDYKFIMNGDEKNAIPLLTPGPGRRRK